MRKTLITVARMGRSMKRCVKRMVVVLACGARRGRRDRAGCWHHLHSWPRTHQAVDDDAVAWLEAAPNNTEAMIELTQLNDLRDHRPIGRNGHHHVLRLVGYDGSR